MEALRRYGKAYLAAIVLFSVLALFAAGTSELIQTAGVQALEPLVYIDPGHGGEDGGAVSVSGVRESSMNLEISLRLRDLLRLCGIRTNMTREGDYAVYDEGCQSFAQKKSSDLRNRAAMLRAAPDAILISIHQNKFPEAKYRGAQTFYNKGKGSNALAERIQQRLTLGVDPRNHRKTKLADGVYLMEKIPNTAVLIECGFLSNYDEEAMLQTPDYQKKLVCAIGVGLLDHLREQTLL